MKPVLLVLLASLAACRDDASAGAASSRTTAPLTAANLRPEVRDDGSAVVALTFTGKIPRGCCLDPVKAALRALGPGVKAHDLRDGEARFTVTYDPRIVTPADLVGALKASGEPIAPAP
jgi:hypothetical protein